MKLQKLLKKLALPVFALVVVGMLAACSSPSGGSSSGNGGDDNSGGAPALTADTEYVIAFSNSLSADEQDALEAEGFAAGDKFTGAEIEGAKADLLAAGYTYTVSGNTVIITKKTTTNTPSGNENKDKDKEKETTTPGDDSSGTPKDAVYTFEEYDEKEGKTFQVTITAKKNGTYVAKMNMKMGEISMDVPVEEGTYVLNGNKVTTTANKMMGESLELEEVPDAYKPYATKTYIIGANNVLTIDESGKSGSGTENGGTANQGSSTGKYKIYYEVKGHDPNLVMELPASLLEAFAKDVGLTDSEYEIDNTKKMILVNEDGQSKVMSKKTLVESKYSEYFVYDDEEEPNNGGVSGSGGTSGQTTQEGSNHYALYIDGTQDGEMDPENFLGLAKAAGVDESEYTINDTTKTITISSAGAKKIDEYMDEMMAAYGGKF